MTENEIAEYLIAHPEFIAKYAGLLNVPSNAAKDGVTNRNIISLSNRQIPQLQQKIRNLENQLDAFLENGRRNEEIWDSLLRSSLALFEIMREDVSSEAISSTLRTHLNVEECRIFVLSTDQEKANEEEKTFANFITSLNKPRCLLETPEEAKHFTKSWILTSSAYVPLSIKNLIGILIFSSSDAQRFDPNIDTQFLERVGNIVSTIIENAYAHQNLALTQHG
ncbi:MAG: DUF484 family protein [Proteobacteria bacterium]|nr:DUF484 family protein [Pseudomonadota bacterium]